MTAEVGKRRIGPALCHRRIGAAACRHEKRKAFLSTAQARKIDQIKLCSKFS
jgi:hypothetical protein